MDARSKEATRSEILWTSGPVPLWIRLITLPFLAGALLLVGQGVVIGLGLGTGMARWSGSPWAGVLIGCLLVLFFAGLWVWNNWLYLDRSGENLVIEHRGLSGRRRRVIRREDVRAIVLRAASIRARHFWDVSLATSAGRKIGFTREYGDPQSPPRELFLRLAEAVRCPIVVEWGR